MTTTNQARVPTTTTYTAKVTRKMMRAGVRALSTALWIEAVRISDERATAAGRALMSEERARELHEEHVDYMLRVQQAIEGGRAAVLALDPQWGCRRAAALAGVVGTPTVEQFTAAMEVR